MTITGDVHLGTEFLGYRIDALIGRGGMGVVYRAYDLRLKRNVALKLIAPELSQDEHFRERFLTETEIAASLEHPNVVPIHDAGELEGQLYLAMRYVEGSDLKMLLKEHGALAPERAIAICAQVAAALDAAHARGLVHRDVKPSNVLLDEGEHAYLADFGLSRRLSEQAPGLEPTLSLGTPAYVAPEQIQGEEADGRADVYSLGCLLYECLTGEAPYPRESELASLWAHLHDDPPVAAAHPALAPVIARALAKKPDDRYGTCRELVEAAREALGLREGVAVRNRVPRLLGAAGVLLALAAGLSAFFLSRTDGGPPRPSTEPTLTPKLDALQRIDPKTNELSATIQPGPRNLVSVAVGEGAVWALSRDKLTILRVDPRTNRVSGTRGVGPDPDSVLAGEGSVWVTSTGLDPPTGFDPATLKAVPSYSAGEDWDYSEGQAAVGEGALWVLDIDGVTRVSPDEVVVKAGGFGLCARGVAAGRGAVWVATCNEVVRLDPKTLKEVARVALPFVPADIAAGREGVWVADRARDAVVKISTATNRVEGRVLVGDSPNAIGLGEGSVWTANVEARTISRIDPRTLKVVATIEIGPTPTDLATGEGGVWVTVHP